MDVTFICILEMQMAKALAGLTDDPIVLTDKEYDEVRDLASIASTDQANQIAQYFVFRLKLLYWFGDAAGALEWAAKVLPIAQAVTGEIVEAELKFFHALALLDYAQHEPGSSKSQLIDRARENLELLSAWSRDCPANFEHKARLVEAEMGTAENLMMDCLFKRSAQEAHDAGFVQYEALAYERLGVSLDKRRELDQARTALFTACEVYSKWGACAKVRQIHSRYSQYFAS
jgi:hypothetical protein